MAHGNGMSMHHPMELLAVGLGAAIVSTAGAGAGK